MLEQKSIEIEYLRAACKLDSGHIVALNKTVAGLQIQITALLQAKAYTDKAYTHMQAACKKLKRQIKLATIKNRIGTAVAAVGSFGVGVGITFIILKTQ